MSVNTFIPLSYFYIICQIKKISYKYNVQTPICVLTRFGYFIEGYLQLKKDPAHIVACYVLFHSQFCNLTCLLFLY